MEGKILLLWFRKFLHNVKSFFSFWLKISIPTFINIHVSVPFAYLCRLRKYWSYFVARCLGLSLTFGLWWITFTLMEEQPLLQLERYKRPIYHHSSKLSYNIWLTHFIYQVPTYFHEKIILFYAYIIKLKSLIWI